MEHVHSSGDFILHAYPTSREALDLTAPHITQGTPTEPNAQEQPQMSAGPQMPQSSYEGANTPRLCGEGRRIGATMPDSWVKQKEASGETEKMDRRRQRLLFLDV